MCPSSSKVLSAARSIMDLLYGVASTSFDVSLLDYLPYVRLFVQGVTSQYTNLCPQLTWFTAGRILVKYLKIALDMNQMDVATALQGEITFVQYVY